MSGGGSQTTKTTPWKEAQPYLLDTMRQAQSLTGQPQQYFPGQTYVGAMPAELSAYQGQQSYDRSMYGAPFSTTLQAGLSSMRGQTPLGQMANQLGSYSTNALQQGFTGAPTVGNYGFSTSLDPYSLTPNFGQAGGLDARSTLQNQLGGQLDSQFQGAIGQANAPLAGLGTPDYSGLQGAIDAANAPLLRQLQQDIIPGLNQRATFLNNETGGIKTLNRVLPDVAERMSQNATGLYEAERQRAAAERAAAAGQMSSQTAGLMGQGLGQAFSGQQNAANLISQGGLSAYGLGLQGATTEAGLQQALAGQNLATDTTNANLANQYQQNLLGLGGLAGQLAGAQGTDAARWGALFPSLAQAGATPYQNQLAYGSYQRGIAENALQDQINRYNFQQQEPYDRLAFYNQMLQGTAGLGGTSRTSTGSSMSGLGALGGAATGAQLGSMLPIPGGTLVGAGLGGLLGLFG